jgi:carbonic anhydrase
MNILSDLFKNNREWASNISRSDPTFFQRLAHQQNPAFLWIGCSDSRVPANEIVGLLPGELFVHRNVANLVIQSDMNCLSVLQYAVEILKIEHIIVCGHYGCGGVKTALDANTHGLIDNWLRPLQALHRRHAGEFADLSDEAACVDRLCELNVVEQVVNVADSTILRAAWARGQAVTVHGWLYSISDGLLRDMNVGVSSTEELDLLKSSREIGGI